MGKIMRTAYQFRLKPDAEQIDLIQKTFDYSRFSYNKMLEAKIKHYAETGEDLLVTPAQFKKDYPFLKEIDSMALCNEQMHLQTAFKNFKRNKKFGFPKFKSRKKDRKSYTTNCIRNNIRIEGKFLVLPKLGRVRFIQHREVPEHYKLKSVTVSMHPSGNFYVSILYEYETLAIEPKPIEKVVGLDYSMPDLYVSSDGERGENPHYFRKSQEKLAKMQRALSRMQYGSNNYLKQLIRIAKLCEHITFQRRDFLHKLSFRIANEYDLVAVEDLSMSSMSRALNYGKSVHDNGWGMFIRFLTYKLEAQGKQLVKVDKWFPSSKTCSKCGAIKHDLSLSDRTFVCEHCGNVIDRDLNAAINIMNEAIRMLALA